MGVGGELWQTDAAAGYALGWDGSVHLPDRVDPAWTWFLGGNEVDAPEQAAALARRFAASAEQAIPGIGAATSAGPSAAPPGIATHSRSAPIRPSPPASSPVSPG
jgi:monoamine oxidase